MVHISICSRMINIFYLVRYCDQYILFYRSLPLLNSIITISVYSSIDCLFGLYLIMFTIISEYSFILCLSLGSFGPCLFCCRFSVEHILRYYRLMFTVTTHRIFVYLVNIRSMVFCLGCIATLILLMLSFLVVVFSLTQNLHTGGSYIGCFMFVTYCQLISQSDSPFPLGLNRYIPYLASRKEQQTDQTQDFYDYNSSYPKFQELNILSYKHTFRILNIANTPKINNFSIQVFINKNIILTYISMYKSHSMYFCNC